MAASYELKVDQGAQLKRRIIHSNPVQKFTAETTDVLTCYGHGFANGDKVYVSTKKPTDTLPSPLKKGVVYFVRDVTQDTFKLASTSGGSAIDLSTKGSGTLYVAKPIDLTGYTAVWHFLPAGQAEATTDSTECGIESPGSNGVIVLNYPDEKTALFENSGTHYLELIPSSGEKNRPFDGKLKLDKKPV